jgi:hypothetical protein
MRAAEAVGEERKRLWTEVTRRDPPRGVPTAHR